MTVPRSVWRGFRELAGLTVSKLLLCVKTSSDEDVGFSDEMNKTPFGLILAVLIVTREASTANGLTDEWMIQSGAV